MKLEPTYLRYIYDGLNKGLLNASNASALPQGFIGLFENELPANVSSFERTSLLKRLALWALFKGAVSTHLASEILQEDEEETKALIDTYSKWFNSPEPGKYILYHDRLRTYFLQKLSSHEVQFLNEKLISYLEAALEDNIVDEAQEYALEHLATHMAVESQLDNNYDRLYEFVNQENLWERQVRVSKEYKWSQQAVQHGIKESARRHHEMNTLTSKVNSVKLMQDEQNSTQQILNLLNDGDYHTALERVLSFKEEKRFVIYLLIIHELTIGTSKDANFKYLVCKKVLDSINKNINTDINIFSSKINFPIQSIYSYYIELNRINIQSNPIWDRKSTTIKFIEYLVTQGLSIEQLLNTVNSIKNLKIDALIILLNKYLADIQYTKDINKSVDDDTGELIYTISKKDDLLRLLISEISNLKAQKNIQESQSEESKKNRDILSRKISYYLDVYEKLVNSSNHINKDILNNLKIHPDLESYIESNKYLIKESLIKNLEIYGWHHDLKYYGRFINLINTDKNETSVTKVFLDQLYSLTKRYKLEDKDIFSHYLNISNKLLQANAFDHVFKLYLELLVELEK